MSRKKKYSAIIFAILAADAQLDEIQHEFAVDPAFIVKETLVCIEEIVVSEIFVAHELG